MDASNGIDSDASESVLHRPVESLNQIGPSRAKELRRRGINTLGDLLEYFPRDYQYESSERDISQLITEQLQIARGEVTAVDYIAARPRGRFEATLEDSTGKLALVWFNGGYLRRHIHPGQYLRVRGLVRIFRNLPQMTQPKWEPIDPADPRVEESKFRPIYPASTKLPSEAMGRIVEENLETALATIEECFDPQLLQLRGLLNRRDAYRLIHLPKNLNDAIRARRRLVYDELMFMQLGLGLSKQMRAGRLTAPVMRIDKTLDQRILRRFPFNLTTAQRNCIAQIVADLRSGQPMNRLLQGDVGSGKTVVALYAMLVSVANRMQAVLLAPTEVLAEQHFLTLTNLLRDSSVTLELFTGRTRQKKQKTKNLSNGSIHIAIGTQALLQEHIEFANLGLVVVDEQHKLGVQQRAVLKSKGLAPHYLVMTATPIPRTLALSYFADFDVSSIDELPPGRQPIRTRRVRSEQAGKAYEFIRTQIEKGRQAYIVLPRIDDDGFDESKSVTKEFDRLSRGPLSGLRLAMLHGQMSADEKQTAMLSFRDGITDILVATTVIEVGIDVPNATVMLIGDAEHFGLSQLHQLRGRVGRGTELSHCLLLSDATSDNAETRLNAMTQTTDGFEIAEMDLKLRGPGEFFGTRQHGLPEFKLADITSETELLRLAKDDATDLLAHDPHLRAPEHRCLRDALGNQLGPTLELAQIG